MFFILSRNRFSLNISWETWINCEMYNMNTYMLYEIINYGVKKKYNLTNIRFNIIIYTYI